MTLPAQHSNNDLGATPPEMILKAINTGLNADHLRVGNPFAYTSSRALVQDLQETFGKPSGNAHGLFMCEMGSQKKDQCIDTGPRTCDPGQVTQNS